MPLITGPFERGQRYTGLKRQAEEYHEQHKEYAESVDQHAERLFYAVRIIADEQGSSWHQVLGLSEPFDNLVFDGGFEYYGPESLGEHCSYAQWFILAALVGLKKEYGGAAGLFYYVSFMLGMVPEFFPLYARMKVGGLLRLVRDPEIQDPCTMVPWNAMGLFLRGKGRSSVKLIELVLSYGEDSYEDTPQTLENVATMRVDACAHAVAMKSLRDGVSDLARRLEEYTWGPKTEVFDIPKAFDEATRGLLTAFEKVDAEVWERLESYDRIYQKGYTGADPDFSEHVLDVHKAAAGNVFRLDIWCDFAVNMIRAETGVFDGTDYGGVGGERVQVFFEEDEWITGATWEIGTLSGDPMTRLIYNLVIQTTARTLGPYGRGGAEVEREVEDKFVIPEGLRCCGLLDSVADWIEHRGEVILQDGPFVVDLRARVMPRDEGVVFYSYVPTD